MHDAPEVNVRVRGKATALSPRAASACARVRAAAAPLAVSSRTRAHATPSARHAPQPARSLPRLSKARLKRVSSRPACLGSARLGSARGLWHTAKTARSSPVARAARRSAAAAPPPRAACAAPAVVRVGVLGSGFGSRLGLVSLIRLGAAPAGPTARRRVLARCARQRARATRSSRSQ